MLVETGVTLRPGTGFVIALELKIERPRRIPVTFTFTKD
jgi:hypothetical protein